MFMGMATIGMQPAQTLNVQELSQIMGEMQQTSDMTQGNDGLSEFVEQVDGFFNLDGQELDIDAEIEEENLDDVDIVPSWEKNL